MKNIPIKTRKGLLDWSIKDLQEKISQSSFKMNDWVLILEGEVVT